MIVNLKGKNKLRKLFVGAFALVASFATGATLLFGLSNAVYANENTTDASTAMDFKKHLIIILPSIREEYGPIKV